MGLDLVIWPDEEALTAEEALSRYKELVNAPAATSVSSAIEGFLTELDDRWPPLKSDPDGSSPWSGSRSVGDQHVLLSMVLSHRNLIQSIDDIFDLAARHGLAVFDPQCVEYTRSDGSRSRVQQPEQDFPELDDVQKEMCKEFEAKFLEEMKRDLDL